jgi:CheY-like chemotaxis protein
VQQIQAAAERAARLTSQLLIVGRREAIALELLDLNTIVTEIHDMLSRSIGEHIELMLNLGTALPAARFDRSQLEQVLLNLAINARDAMPTGGMLSIRTRFLEVDTDFVRGHPDVQVGPYVELAVSDSGMGMTREVIDRAFDPFFTTKPQGQGTGLGLATVYGVVTGAGGLVMIYSEPGLGTTVRVLLPAASEPAAEPPAPPDLTAAGHGETVVVVDDEAAMMEVAARILRRAGYTVLATTTPAAAIELIEDNDVSLLLTDCVMPGMSGLQLAQEALLIRPALAVLFMSGYDQGMLGAQQLVADEAELIRKPFNAEHLVERVASRLR